jgi:putative ABC transport system ATP-binding protein
MQVERAVAKSAPVVSKAVNVPAIEVVNVTKTYRVGHTDYPALRGVSFKIGRGELVSIVGPSGSGKSTLLNLIGALDLPTSGNVFVDGIKLRKLNEDQLALLRNRKIGFVYQSFNLIQRLTTIENVEMPLIARGVSEKARRIKAIRVLKAVGLGNKLNKRPTELSGGEQQRVAVARALVPEPALVIGDEPTGNLDSKTTREILNLVVQMNKTKGITFILVTHNNEVAEMTHRMISIRDGLVEKEQLLHRLDSFTERGAEEPEALAPPISVQIPQREKAFSNPYSHNSPS